MHLKGTPMLRSTLALVVALMAMPVVAQDANKLVWGGGDPATSAYSGVNAAILERATELPDPERD